MFESPKPFKPTPNYSYFSYMAGLWTVPELAMGIIAGCLPSCPKFFQALLQTAVISKWSSYVQNSMSGLFRQARRSSDSSRIVESEAQCTKSDGLRKPPDQYPLTSFASVRSDTVYLTAGSRLSTSS